MNNPNPSAPVAADSPIAPRWGDRLSASDLAALTRRALAAGLFTDQRAVLFHDLDLLAARVAALQQAFPAHTTHAVAVKAMPVVPVLRQLVRLGAGLECASIEEVHLALAAGCACDQVVFDSPAKTVEEIAFALSRGLHLNADNFDELARIDALLAQHPEWAGRAVVGLRVNPQVGPGRIAITSVGHAVSKFGVPLDESRGEIVAAFRRWPWLRALHIHVGSQGVTLEQLVEAAHRLFGLVEEVEAATAPGRVTHLDVGGGLPVAYLGGDAPPSLRRYTERLRAELPELMGGRFKLLTEFGRAVHANCGAALSRVEYVKTVGGVRMVVAHLGADFLVRPAYHPQDWRHEFVLLDAEGRLKEGPAAPCAVVGPLCFGGDVIGRDVVLSNTASAGDLLLIRDVGAYTLGMWSRHCSRGQPRLIGARAESLEVLREAQSVEDIVKYWDR